MRSDAAEPGPRKMPNSFAMSAVAGIYKLVTLLNLPWRRRKLLKIKIDGSKMELQAKLQECFESGWKKGYPGPDPGKQANQMQRGDTVLR